jgi:hypothetical protein
MSSGSSAFQTERGVSEGGSNVQEQARQAGARLSDAARQVGEHAHDTAASIASEAGERMHGYMNQKVAAGAELVSEIAKSIRVASDNLEHASPMLAGAMRGAADKVHGAADHVRNKSVDELLADARDIVRHKPALVFTGAAAFGFLAFRLLNIGLTTAHESSSYRSPTVTPPQSPTSKPVAASLRGSSSSPDNSTAPPPTEWPLQPAYDEASKPMDPIHGR